MINGLDLFTGIGGLTIALNEWVKPIAYCEIDPYCQSVILNRISDGSFPNAPIWDDIQTLSYDGRNWPQIDIIYGGFPCQDISIAGHGKGLEGKRSGLFFEILRLAKEIKPKFIFLENVPAIATRGGLQVVNEITSLGYDCRWCTISAASVGALHKRERWFLLAHTPSKSTNRHSKRKETAYTMFRNASENVCNTNGITSEQTYSRTESYTEREKAWGRFTGQYWPFESREHWQETVSEMGKCSDGIPNHVARLRALGNAVVPCQAKKAFKILMGLG